MTLHPFVLAYGQRRGYGAMTDLNRILLEESNLFSRNNSTRNSSSTTYQLINYSLATDLTLNFSDSSIYLNELNLLASFYKTLRIDERLKLRSIVDGIILYFKNKLSNYGHSSEILKPVLEEFDFPPETEVDSVQNDSTDIRRLIINFLTQFRTPLIYEYFQMETDFLASSNPVENRGNEKTVDMEFSNTTDENNEENVESETEDNVEDPHWWKKDCPIEIQEEIDDPKKKIDSNLISILEDIRQISMRIPNMEKDDVCPYSVKIYNLSINGNRGRSSAVCADLTSDGRMACFGCDSDSSIKYFSLRQNDNTTTTNEVSNILHMNSQSGIVYRCGFLENSMDELFLLATSDDPSNPISLFDLTSNKKIYDYRGHRWPVWALDVAKRGGGMFVTGSYDRTARLFLLDRKDPLRIFVGHESSVDCVRFIQDAFNQSSTDIDIGYPPFISTASSDGTVRIWSLNDAIAVRVFHGMKGFPTSLAYRSTSPDGHPTKLLACSTTEGKIFIYELDTGRTYQILEGVLANDLEFSPDGRFLLAAGDGGFFKIYRLSEEANGSVSNQYKEIQLNENLFFHNKEAKFLKVAFIENEIICLTA